jgi:predicted DNA-binding protein (UPF0251 family)
MPRPTKSRRVAYIPEIIYFKPAGIPLRILEEMNLTIEEAEAMRLKDLEALEQESCAEKMNISRQTFQRILGSARRKVTDALLNGKAIKIEGGNFKMSVRKFRCSDGHEWDVPFEATTYSQSCPTCNDIDIMPVQPHGIGKGKSNRIKGLRRGHKC